MAEEQVLVVETKLVETQGLFHGLQFDVKRYIDTLFVKSALRFMPRSQAENDPTYKQLIPYVLMTHNGCVLSYVRGKRAGETRLVSKRSIGIGGHINPVDDAPLFGEPYATYLAAVEREIKEEVDVQANYTDHVVALLNDDTNEVGKVHLGIVHLWNLDTPAVTRREQMITQLEFIPIPKLREMRETMETWSALCLDGIEKMQAQ